MRYRNKNVRISTPIPRSAYDMVGMDTEKVITKIRKFMVIEFRYRKCVSGSVIIIKNTRSIGTGIINFIKKIIRGLRSF